ALGAVTRRRAVRSLAHTLPPAGRKLAGFAEFLLQVCIVIAGPLPMRRIVLPLFGPGAAIDIDGAAAPIDAAAAPIAAAAPVAAPRPAAEPIGRAEGNAGANDAAANIVGISPIIGIGGIIRLRPVSVDDGRFIIGNVDLVGYRG